MTIKQDDIEEKYLEAKSLFENGILKNAKELFVELTLKKPFKWEFWFALATIYEQEKNYTQAIISYNMVIVLNSKNAQSYLHLAECFLSQNDKKRAIENLKLAEKNANDPDLKDKVQVLIKQNLK